MCLMLNNFDGFRVGCLNLVICPYQSLRGGLIPKCVAVLRQKKKKKGMNKIKEKIEEFV
jgi:hypothetical protein